jgi:uncharacterized protein
MAQSLPDRPANYTPINDFAAILFPSELEALNNQLLKYEKESSTQIAVVTVESLGGLSVEMYANKLFNQWGIGQKGADNGILLLIAKSDRKMRIEVGYGAEPYVTDAEAARIIDRILTPHFKRAEFGEGIELAIGELLSELGVAEFEPVLAKARTPSPLDFFTHNFIWVWVFLIVGALLQGFLGYYLTWKVEDGIYTFLINTLFVVLAIILLVAASEERESVLTYVYLPLGLSALCIVLYLIVLLPKAVGKFVGKVLFILFILFMSALPAMLVTALLSAFISENGWFVGIVLVLSWAIFFYLMITGKIDITSGSGGSYSSSSYSSGGSSYSSSSYSSGGGSSWGGGSSGGGGASGSW